MNLAVDGLDVIAHKAPVVATHVGGFDRNTTNRIFTRYSAEAQTYIRPVEIERYQRKLLDTILDNRLAMGCLVAPFGYGKTSTAINIWKACELENILAIPPFSCGSVSEMGLAIATGIACKLDGTMPDAAAKIRAAYDVYLVASATRLAEEDHQQYHIDFDAALKSIEDKIKRGYLQLEASATHLLSFLEQLVQIVLEAGYRGLLVIVDEFQQFLGNLNKAVINNFRTLVWGLRTRPASPFGFLITMDPDTERNLSDRAGDILDRIKQDGLYLDFASVYDREFPRLLWSRYAELFGFQPESQRVIDLATLEAIGQICERTDLSNGPRTVIDIFQRIATSQVSRLRPYSPIDLIDDFITGRVIFDGNRGKIASLVTELSSSGYIKKSREKLLALKLIAAFPQGCAREVAGGYNLEKAFDDLLDITRGEILTELSEGVALIDLQRVGKPQNKLNIILRKYWLQITEDELIADRAVPLFTKYTISYLFPPFRNVLSGWRPTESEFILNPSGSYIQIYEGTFFEEYPLRRVCVQVCTNLEQADAPPDSVDVHLLFVLQKAGKGEVHSEYIKDQRTFVLPILINQAFDRPLPRDIRWIEDYLRPVVLTPGVLLSLLDYIKRQVPHIEGMTENELQRINETQHKLQGFLLTMLFGEELFSGLGIQVLSRGEQAVRDVLFFAFRTIFPEYRTLITSPQWESVLETYTGVLQSLSPLQSRGIEPLSDSKPDIAARFGYRSHAGFDSQAKQFDQLLTLEEWIGDRGTLQFTRHPGENALLNIISMRSRLTRDEALLEAHKAGYLAQETNYLLQFLSLRGHIQYVPEQELYIPARTLSPAELKALAHEILHETELMQRILTDSTLEMSYKHVQELLLQLSQENTDLSDAQVRLLQIQLTVREARSLLIRQFYTDLQEIRSRLYKLVEVLKQELSEIDTGLALDTHINGAMRIIIRDNASAVKRLSRTLDIFSDVLERPIDADGIKAIETLIERHSETIAQGKRSVEDAEKLVSQMEVHRGWVKLVGQIKRLGDYVDQIASITDVSGLRSELNEVVAQMRHSLSMVGLNEYDKALETYQQRVNLIANEINGAIKVAEMAQNKSNAKPSRRSSSKSSTLTPKEIILQAVQSNGNLSFADISALNRMSDQQLVTLLKELESNGELIIRIEKGTQ